MAIYWITGTPGVGKSAVAGRMSTMGLRAIDTDSQGFNVWVNRSTGAIDSPPDPLPADWTARHWWCIDPGQVEALAAASSDQSVYLCGVVGNEDDVRQHFTAIVCLVADDSTLRHRIATRVNPYGKDPRELAGVLGWNKTIESEYRARGASIVDASQPLDVVVEAILRLSAHSQR